MTQVCRLGPKVGSRLALFCIHHLNRVKSLNDSMSHDESTIIIVLVLFVVVVVVVVVVVAKYCCTYV